MASPTGHANRRSPGGQEPQNGGPLSGRGAVGRSRSARDAGHDGDDEAIQDNVTPRKPAASDRTERHTEQGSSTNHDSHVEPAATEGDSHGAGMEDENGYGVDDGEKRSPLSRRKRPLGPPSSPGLRAEFDTHRGGRESSNDNVGGVFNSSGRNAFAFLSQSQHSQAGGRAGSEAYPEDRIGNSAVAESTMSDYGCTPAAMRRVRYARADLGDMGREFLMRDSDMLRLPEVPTDIISDELEIKFTEFFDKFNALDYFSLVDLSAEDRAVVEMAEARAEMNNSSLHQVHLHSHYHYKLIRYMEFCAIGADRRSSVGGSKASSSSSMMKDKMGGALPASNSFNVSLRHLFAFDKALYGCVVNSPQDAVAVLDVVVRKRFKDLKELFGCFDDNAEDDADFLLSSAPRLRFYEKPAELMDNPRDLDPKDIESLVCIRGVVIRCSELIPEVTMAAFRCTGKVSRGINQVEPCTEEVYETVVNGEIAEPRECRACKSKGSFELWHNQCAFASKQLIKISEIAEDIQPGETPQSISAYAYDDLLEACKPGDRVEITGIFKASGVRINPRLRYQGAVFRTFINVMHVRLDERSRIQVPAKSALGRGVVERRDDGTYEEAVEDVGSSFGCFDMSEEELQKIMELSREPKLYDMMVQSLAPSIYGKDDVKKGLLCQLVGGTKQRGKNEHGAFRSELHILLCGDPATAKSQLLNYVHKLAPRGVCTSGKGSSQVGLTAFVTRDPETGEFILESGAVVLSDRGVCCIDEFDKMDDGARAVLHEVMEQQTVSVAKAGIVATLNARTAILASANPVNSRYDRHRAVVDNINLPPSLFSRFDLIYLVLDAFDANEDRRLAESLCSSFSGKDSERRALHKPPIPQDLLARYISYARASVFPVLSSQARDVLVQEYLRMRHRGDESSRAPTATPRQLEGLIRISQALAKLRLSSEVAAQDAVEAVRLMNVATFQSLIDPVSGRLDFDQMTLGQTLQHRKVLQTISDAITTVLRNASSPMSQEELFQAARDHMSTSQARPDGHEVDVPIGQFQEALGSLEKTHVVSRKTGSGLLFMSDADLM